MYSPSFEHIYIHVHTVHKMYRDVPKLRNYQHTSSRTCVPVHLHMDACVQVMYVMSVCMHGGASVRVHTHVHMQALPIVYVCLSVFIIYVGKQVDGWVGR